jgi:apolipoprotein N-acyltransferase
MVFTMPSGWRRQALALAAGLIAALALPPVYFIVALWISLPILVRLIDSAAGTRAAFVIGWWFGLGHFAAGIYWIAEAMLVDPEHFAWMIPFAVLGLGAWLGLFPAAAAAAAFRLAPRGPARVLMLAAAWTVFEWVRGWLFTGFPWNLMGTVWVAVPPLLQFAALGGAFGLSALTVAAAAMPAVLGSGVRGARTAFAASLAVLVAVGAWGMIRVPAAPVASVPGIRLRLVQPNIEQTLKWRPEMRAEHLNRHLQLSAAPGKETITDLIWPETAAPSFVDEDGLARAKIATVIPSGGLLLTGVVRGTPREVEPLRIWNSLEVLDGKGDVLAIYDKAHLVPFGEYMPLRAVLPLAKITPGAIDYTPGPGPATITVPGLPPFSPSICYEAIFADAVVPAKPRPAWLLNVTNDGWFGTSAGPHQHFAAARLRAVEQGLPLVRAANTGISAVVDPYGRVVASLLLGQAGVLDSELPVSLTSPTLYAKAGLAIPFLIVLLFVAISLALRRFL